jgi:hypothetical protein
MIGDEGEDSPTHQRLQRQNSEKTYLIAKEDIVLQAPSI